MINSVLVILVWVIPFIVVAFFLYSDLPKGSAIKDFDWASLLLSAIPLIGFAVVFVSLLVVIHGELWDRVKNIKIN